MRSFRLGQGFLFARRHSGFRKQGLFHRTIRQIHRGRSPGKRHAEHTHVVPSLCHAAGNRGGFLIETHSSPFTRR